MPAHSAMPSYVYDSESEDEMIEEEDDDGEEDDSIHLPSNEEEGRQREGICRPLSSVSPILNQRRAV